MYRFAAALCVLGAVLFRYPSCALAADAPPPFEVVKNHIEVEVNAGGSYLESREIAYRVLTEQGAAALRQVTLSFTQGYQDLQISTAYTLKKDGSRIDVGRTGIMRGYGATSSPGFQDLKTETVVFPNVEIGDEVVMSTIMTQTIPWFGDSYAGEFIFGREVPAHDVSIALTTPSTMALRVDAVGMTSAPPETLGGKTRQVWHFDNPAAARAESRAVDNFDRGARLVISSFKDYAAFAEVYRGMIKDRAEVTPEIRALADKVTEGLKSDREQARALYEWVSLHIGYLNIVLGAGGFIPHRAADVLANKYGDCKDHVTLLQALLAAKGIASSPVLISAENRYTFSPSPSPFAFNHLISYIPEFNLYLDSTARYAPFGVLPYADAGKPVVRVATGETARTPPATAVTASIRSVETVTVAPDGSIAGETHVTATGAPAADLRAMVNAAKASGEATYFRTLMGPGIDGTLDGGNVGDLSPTYAFSARYRKDNALNIPGPGAIPYDIVYKPFSFTSLIADELPPARTQPYVCLSMEAEEDLTIHLPATVHVVATPQSQTLSVGDVSLAVVYSRPDANTVHLDLKAHVDHPEATCTPAYFARVRSTLVQMTAALRAQMLYQ